MELDRRAFLIRTATAAAIAAATPTALATARSAPLTRPHEPPSNLAMAPASTRLPGNVEVTHPRNRVPLSFIIDDSTCLVNMAHFCMPQFAATWPDRQDYRRPWRDWPREIPDAFVREFGEWCAEQGVKGKYSVVPYPACVGWLDRELPGWSRRQLQDSLRLVRELLVPNWDIHPEMITHTRVIDLKTGRPLEPISPTTMENWYPREDKSVDEMASYLAYALRILKNCDLPCEGVTTPGGFGTRVRSTLGLAVRQAVQDVYDVEIPHYFKYVIGDEESTEPTLEHVNLRGPTPELTVNIPAGTGDWFGGWDGTREVEGDRYANRDATSGRMVELIERGEPAVMLCHWPGLFNNGRKTGLRAFQNIVLALADRFGDQTQWMKLSEMARYYATKQTVTAEFDESAESLTFESRFACPQFTFRWQQLLRGRLICQHQQQSQELTAVATAAQLRAGTFYQDQDQLLICLALPAGTSTLRFAD